MKLLRELAPQVLAAVVRRHGDFASAEDAVQEALVAAAMQWPKDGVPDNPRGWLIQVAARRFTDQLRSDIARQKRETTMMNETEQTVPPPDELLSPTEEEDDTLRLLFMCCHASLSRTSAIALTLRAVAGLTTAEIAKAFLVPEATMAQRISRAKQTIKKSGASFQDEGRLDVVLPVLYLVFNEGYYRPDLASEAIRLTRQVRATRPNDGEVAGLLSLMLLTEARRGARTTEDGDVVALDEQDRSLWDRAAIEEGTKLVEEAIARGSVGTYQLQAAIASLHDEAPNVDATDWPQILALYTVLDRMARNPIVTLNRAVALAMVQGPKAGLDLLRTIEADERIADHHNFHAVRAHLLERAGEREAAVAHYRKAAERTTSTPERNYLLIKAAKLTAS